MDFKLSEEDLELKKMARDLAEKRIYPIALEMDENEETPEALIKECAELGYFGFTVPEEYGGLGMSATSFMGVLEEICAASAGFGIMLSVHNSLACEIIRLFGSEELKQTYLPVMAAGEKIGSYCVTEPNAGTDVASLSTNAVLDGDQWVINGTKTYVTNAKYAGVFIVFAKTHPDEGRNGISCFVVDAGTPGMTIGKAERKCGIKASDTREVSFADVRIPKSNMLGHDRDGFRMAVTILNSGRIGVSFQAIGIAQSALNEALRYSKERRQFNQPISNFQAIQFKLADMATRIDAGRLLAYRAARLKDAGEPCHREASMSKLYCSEMANFVCNEAVQIHGGYGYIKEYPVERYFRDARVTELYEGTSEAQRMVISRDLLRE
ncbi:MAG: acyl-CoA dehydrogenase family protein [candidate division Zixibacteria bacterium]|jgi:alkylation response protein AidB-like acyl-CoA dehydrogenase|nr:acyl-CoA dehydrogenase family protein [candidate division Zixibacteria bacterium]